MKKMSPGSSRLRAKWINILWNILTLRFLKKAGNQPFPDRGHHRPGFYPGMTAVAMNSIFWQNSQKAGKAFVRTPITVLYHWR